ncbi:hypothetical protein K474DRAFT_1608564, partial [Panus rudis PR-1116 ss-1]
RLSKSWTSTVYSFYKADVSIIEKDGRRGHVFACYNKGCKTKITRWLNTKDSRSTSNLARHAKKCWGADAVAVAQDSGASIKTAREGVERLARNGTITDAFQRTGKGKVSYSTTAHTKTETRMMKTGRPSHYIPHPKTVSRDVKNVFVNVRQRIANLLKDFDGDLSFDCDCWSSPNHRAFAAITVHLHVKGEPLRFLLDLVEVPFSHTGENLAEMFHQVLKDFLIEEYVSIECISLVDTSLPRILDPKRHRRQRK